MTEVLLREGCGPQGWPESQTLDFKQLPPGTDARARQEFLKDVCAFANADGGDIVYGVGEQNGVAHNIVPIVGESEDALRRRLVQILDAGLQPRVSGISMNPVPIAAGAFVWIVRVPASFDGPHRYQHEQHDFRFVVRNGTLTSVMTYDQLRTAFDRSATLVERAREFRAERMDRIKSGNTWHPLTPGPLAIVHLLPLAAMAGRSQVDVGALHDGNWMAFAHRSWAAGGRTRTLSIDGLLVYPLRAGGIPTVAYSHIFRTGCLEAVRNVGHPDNANVIPSGAVATFVRQTVGELVMGAVQIGFTGPAIIALTLVRLGGVQFGLGEGYTQNAARIDRSELAVPEGWVDALDGLTDVAPIVRPLLDTLWQCFGEPRFLG